MRQPLPFIEHHRTLSLEKPGGIRFGDIKFRRIVETVDCSCPFQGGAGLSYAFGPFDRQGWEFTDQFVEFIVDNPALVGKKWIHA